jgi:hypothetical protein
MTYKYRIVELKRRDTAYDWSDAFLTWMKLHHPLVEIPDYESRNDDETESIRAHMRLFNEANPGIRNFQEKTVPGYYYILQRKQLFWWVWTGMQANTIENLKIELAETVRKMQENFEDSLHRKVVEEFDLEVKLTPTTRYY